MREPIGRKNTCLNCLARAHVSQLYIYHLLT